MKLFKYLIFLIAFQSQAQNIFQITGRVTDQNGNVISYAHIQIAETNIGTLTNQEGSFSINVAKRHCKNWLQFSHVGYKTSKIRLNCKNNSIQVKLEEEPTLLNDVSVSTLTARQLVEKAIEQLKTNYYIDSINYELFLRNSQEKQEEPVLLQEYVFNLLSINGTRNDFYIKKIRSKSFTKGGNKDERKNKTSIIPSIEAHLMLKYVPDFLERKKMKRFTYEFGEDIIYQGDTLYVIHIKPLKKNYTQSGELWIDVRDYGIAYVQKQSADEFWDEKAILNRIRKTYYTKKDSKWKLSHGNYSFTEKIQKTNELIDHKFITVVTATQPLNSLDEREKMNDSYWVKTKKFYQSFDDNFWEDYNFIPLETNFKNVLQAEKNQ